MKPRATHVDPCAGAAPDQGGNAVKPSDQPGLVPNRTKLQVQHSARATPRVREGRATTKVQIGATYGHMRSGKVRRTASRHSRPCKQAQTCFQEHPPIAPPGVCHGAHQPLEHNNPCWENTQLHCTGQLSTCVGRTPQVCPSSKDWKTFPHLTRSHWVISSGGTVPASTGARTRPSSRL